MTNQTISYVPCIKGDEPLPTHVYVSIGDGKAHKFVPEESRDGDERDREMKHLVHDMGVALLEHVPFRKTASLIHRASELGVEIKPKPKRGITIPTPYPHPSTRHINHSREVRR